MAKGVLYLHNLTIRIMKCNPRETDYLIKSSITLPAITRDIKTITIILNIFSSLVIQHLL